MRKYKTPDAWAQVGRELGSICREHPWTVADWWVSGDDLPRGVRMANRPGAGLDWSAV